MNVRLIVPRRADGGHRDKLWSFCRAYWVKERPAWEVVEGHHEDGLFNRSAAINRAATGEWDVAVILDSDTILDVDSIDAAIARAHETGHLVLPFKVRCLLNQAGTVKILRGHSGSWSGYVAARQTPRDRYEYISGCQVVPRALWDEVDGFDERFEGWGGEDDAFHAACTALTGHDARCDRLEGRAWHLWHRPSPHANHRTATYRQAKALSDRYVATTDAGAMRRLLGEPRGPDQIVLVALTNDRRPHLEQTIRSAAKSLKGPIGRQLLCVDDCASPGHERRIAKDLPGWDVQALGKSRGYAHAVAATLELAIGSGQPWIFFVEDDFTFNEPVDLRAMQALMDAHPEIAQLALLRQAWFEHETAAGGLYEAKPEAFTQREGYVEHRDFWTMNPMLTRRALLAEHQWPLKSHSERRFGQAVFKANGHVGAIWGKLKDKPRVTHIGAERAGTGY